MTSINTDVLFFFGRQMLLKLACFLFSLYRISPSLLYQAESILHISLASSWSKVLLFPFYNDDRRSFMCDWKMADVTLSLSKGSRRHPQVSNVHLTLKSANVPTYNL
jgi:hypothetical protein